MPDLVNLGIGDPDLPTADFIVSAMERALRDPSNYRYPDGRGSRRFRQAVAGFMKRRYGVSLDPETQIIALIGSKEGIAHLPLALTAIGDRTFVPDPGYPVYQSSSIFAGAVPITVPLLEKNGFLPDLKAVKQPGRLLFLNYPNNPTGAVAGRNFLDSAVRWALKKKCWLAGDAAYAEAFFDGVRPPSLLSSPGALDVAVEFHSLSKTFNMTGWRVGWACGNAEAIAALAKVKNNIDSGVFGAVQEAAVAALEKGDEAMESMRRTFGARRALFAQGLKKIGWSVFESSATFYLWCRTPEKMKSMACVERLIEEAGVVAVPGVGFGKNGEGYLRFALTVPEPKLTLALQKIASVRW